MHTWWIVFYVTCLIMALLCPPGMSNTSFRDFATFLIWSGLILPTTTSMPCHPSWVFLSCTRLSSMATPYVPSAVKLSAKARRLFLSTCGEVMGESPHTLGSNISSGPVILNCKYGMACGWVCKWGNISVCVCMYVCVRACACTCVCVGGGGGNIGAEFAKNQSTHYSSNAIYLHRLRTLHVFLGCHSTIFIFLNSNQISVSEEPERPSLPSSSSSAPAIAGTYHASQSGAIDIVYCNQKATCVPPELLESMERTAINTIDMSRNAFTIVPPEIAICASTLKSLNFSFNKLCVVPGSVLGALHNLVALDLRNNSLTSLPEELCALKSLREIALSFNRFTALPPVVFSIPTLNTLVISDNQIMAIDAAQLGTLHELKCLDLSNNNIANVRAEGVQKCV